MNYTIPLADGFPTGPRPQLLAGDPVCTLLFVGLSALPTGARVAKLTDATGTYCYASATLTGASVVLDLTGDDLADATRGRQRGVRCLLTVSSAVTGAIVALVSADAFPAGTEAACE